VRIEAGNGVVERRTYACLEMHCRTAVVLALTLCATGCLGSSSHPTHVRFAHHANRGGTHIVVHGETIYHIAHDYGVSSERLMEANGLSDARQLRAGQALIIPDGGFASASIFGIPDTWAPPRAERQFAWPVNSGLVSSPFGMRNGVMHDGVDINAPAGSAVNAADDGVVIFCGHLHGYGNVVILQHSAGYVTVYGHNRVNLVRDGERVARGQQVAELGATGRASGPNLHFEVRHDNQAQNPIAYLPEPAPESGISFARNSGS
jgi:murein DD-endopeptidase MepM/ murein hydrolase activator NlpD